MPINFFNKFSATKGKNANMIGNNFGGSAFTAKGLQMGSKGKKRALEIDALDRRVSTAGLAATRTLDGRQGEKVSRSNWLQPEQPISFVGDPLFGHTREMEQKFDADAESANLHNAGFTLAFMHVPTGREVEFKAFLDQISDAYTTNWSQESVYGRMDQIATFQNTQRAIAVSWIVPASSEMEAIHNMKNIQHLMQFMYPLYSDDGILLSSPLLRLKFANLIRDGKTGKGLLGYVNGFTVDPDQEAGYFAYSEGPMTAQAELYPKAIRLNCDFTVLHEHDLGYRTFSNVGGDGMTGYIFGRSSQEIKDNPGDIQGVDFPFPAGAGDPNIEGRPFIPVSNNSHFESNVISGDEGQAENLFKQALLFEDNLSPKSAKYIDRRKRILRLSAQHYGSTSNY